MLLKPKLKPKAKPTVGRKFQKILDMRVSECLKINSDSFISFNEVYQWLQKNYGRDYARIRKQVLGPALEVSLDLLRKPIGSAQADSDTDDDDEQSFKRRRLDEGVYSSAANDTMRNLYKKMANEQIEKDKLKPKEYKQVKPPAEKGTVRITKDDLKKETRSANRSGNFGNIGKAMRNHFYKNASDPSQKKREWLCTRPTERYSDVGGIEKKLQEVRELIEYPLSHPEIYEHLGVTPPRGVLLHGPPGCGKTLLAKAVAGELGCSFIMISAPEIVSGMSGQSEAKIRSLFTQAVEKSPCLVFIDEIDTISGKREKAKRQMEQRIVAQLLTSMDELTSNNASVMVLGATNRPDAIDSALRRAGRFDREICIGVPDTAARERILKVLTSKMKLSTDFSIPEIAKKAAGFVGADLSALTKEAAVIAVNRVFRNLFSEETSKNNTNGLVGSNNNKYSSRSSAAEGCNKTSANLSERTLVSNALKARAQPLTAEQLKPLKVEMKDFLEALKVVQPSAQREGFATKPDTTWNDVGALEDVREKLTNSILMPIKRPELFKELKVSVPCGVLLHGPPGCGKTLLAKAVASESGASFISIKGPELLNKYVGESERAVRQVFLRARSSPPCVIFFDELDALAPKRGRSGDAGAVSERVVNQLLTEMDGLTNRGNIFVIAATNRVDIIDEAMLRPGRLDKVLHVPLPTREGIIKIFKTHLRGAPLEEGLTAEKIGGDKRTVGFSGADVASLVREAKMEAVREVLESEASSKEKRSSENKESSKETNHKEEQRNNMIVCEKHFEKAFKVVFPSVTKKSKKKDDHAFWHSMLTSPGGPSGSRA